MTLFQIKAFLTLSDTLNYARASSMLHTTQPNLSKIIFNLEQTLGVQLFTRNKRCVKLTPAGETFCKEMQVLMNQYDYAFNKVREVDAGIKGSIEVGFLAPAVALILPQIICRFREEHPDILIKLSDYSYSRLLEAILEGKLDIAMIPDRELDRIPNLKKKFMFADDMCLVVPSKHPLAGVERIDLSMARDDPFVIIAPKVSIFGYNLVTDICMENNFAPKSVHLANTLTSLLMMIECGVGVSVLASHMIRYASEKVSFVKINGGEGFFQLTCAWRSGTEKENSCVTHLLNVIDECLEDGWE